MRFGNAQLSDGLILSCLVAHNISRVSEDILNKLFW